MMVEWIRQEPVVAMGIALSLTLALDMSVVLLFHSGNTSGRKRAWYRMWSKRLAGLNGILVRVILVLWLVLHVWWTP